MKSKPKLTPQIWVNVNHQKKTITYVLNEHKSMVDGGSFMTSKEFNTYKSTHPIESYTLNVLKVG